MISEDEINHLFSMYYVQNILKDTGTGKVFLLSNRQGERKVVKAVPKNEEGKESLQSEISILQTLNHRGIPRLYDVKETEDCICILEQYIEGRTLYEIIRTEGVLPLEQALFYGKQLAEILIYLQSVKPDAVLHLDIQPKNIIIYKNKLSLIDFGNAAYMGYLEQKYYLKGTRGYAAPEQYTGKSIDIRTDIYGMGCCILYMLTGKTGQEALKEAPLSVRELLGNCMEQDKEKRPDSAIRFGEELRCIEKINGIRNHERNPVIVSFAGTQQRIGTSVIAMGFASYLRRIGLDASYEECNQTGMVRKLVKYETSIHYSQGEFWYGDLPIRPRYESQQIKLTQMHDILIRDEGVYEEKKQYGQGLVVVAGVSPWEVEFTEQVCKNLKCRQILTPCQKLVLIWNFFRSSGEQLYFGKFQMDGFDMPFLNRGDTRREEAVYKRIAERLELAEGNR